jgi:hypothetical protein
LTEAGAELSRSLRPQIGVSIEKVFYVEVAIADPSERHRGRSRGGKSDAHCDVTMVIMRCRF